MKQFLHRLLLMAGVVLSVTAVNAQASLAPDQNPNYAASRAKYMKVADSLNQWHSTTFQNTYKAMDWLADRQEARADRREFRRQMRTQRIGWMRYYDNYYYPSYRNNWGAFNNGYYRGNTFGRGFLRSNYWWR